MIEWPEGTRFAFTVFDDTDDATLGNVREVYALLADLGFRTTKSVWPLRGRGAPDRDGATCEEPDYLRWLRSLQEQGFEIGFHMATSDTSPRQDTMRGLDRFAELFGSYPRSMANHSTCEENLYWGPYRLSGARRLLYNVVTRGRNRGRFRGHVVGDPLFWGDVCRERIRYVRNFDFADINTLKQCPIMPYHDPERPFVNYWFASSDGHDVDAFVACVGERHQDRLEEEGGACVMYTHFARGFHRDGRLDPRFARLMERLSRRGGWFVPVSALLDFMFSRRGHRSITSHARRALEWRWLWYKMRAGTA